MASHFRTTRQWRQLRLQILERDGYVCQIRGTKCTGNATEVDHIIPDRDGGERYDPSNLRAACKWWSNWRAQRQKQLHDRREGDRTLTHT